MPTVGVKGLNRLKRTMKDDIE